MDGATRKAVPYRWLANGAVLALLPAIVLALYPAWYVQKGWSDPFIYSGLIHNYDDVVDRFGGTYYAARIAHIFPAIFFDKLFGPAGFYVFRFVFLLAAALAAFAFGTRLYSDRVGLMVAALAVCSPWLLFPYNGSHYDGTATIYLLLGYVFALVPTHRSIVTHAIAGAFVALAISVNQFTAAVFFTVVPAWLVMHRSVHPLKLVGMVAVGTASVVIIYLGLGELLGLTNPRWRETGDPTISVINLMLSGKGAEYYHSWSAIVEEELWYWIAIPAIVLLAAPLLVWRSQSSVRLWRVIFALALGFGVLLLFLTMDKLKFASLQVNFYIIYMFPTALLAATVILGEYFSQWSVNVQRIAAGVLIIAILALWAFMSPAAVNLLDKLELNSFLAFAGTVLILSLAALLLKQRTIAAMVSAVGLLFLFLAPYQYWQIAMIRDPASDGWDIKRGQDFLMDVVARDAPPSQGRIGFWYDASDRALNSIQSAWLWDYARAMPYGSSGMPVLDEDSKKRMDGFARMVLMSRRQDKLEEGKHAYETYATSGERVIEWIDSGHFQGSKEESAYFYAIAKRSIKDAPAPVADANTIGWVDTKTCMSDAAWAPSKVSFADGVLKINTTPASGGFSALVDIPDALQRPGPGIVRIWVRVTQGQLGVNRTRRGNSGLDVSDLVLIPKEEKEIVVTVSLANLSEPSWLVFSNQSSSGPSVAMIRAIEVAQLGAAYSTAPSPTPTMPTSGPSTLPAR